MTDHVIRLAGQADLQQVLDIQATRESPHPPPPLIERWVRNGEFWVSEGGERIVGWVSLANTFFEQGFVSTLWVDESFRRQGIAKRLIRQVETVCSTDRIWTSTNLSNHAMHGLMRSMRWKVSGLLHYLDPDDPEVVYVNTG